MLVSNETILQRIRRTGIVPLFTPENEEEGLAVIEAAYNAGIRVFEMTNRRDNSHAIFTELIRRQNDFPDLILGIGTIMDGHTTQKFIDSGAQFIISPILNAAMASVCNTNRVTWIPGCATLTEIMNARDCGAEIIKLFPGSVLGPGFVSSILPVVPDLRLMITGGVEPTQASLASWFNAGAYCVGMGSHLFPRRMLETKAWPDIQNRIQDAVNLAKKMMHPHEHN
jgi:2-dehydro-3-deoxyphosphogluconate aldolase / (4S)-4-hydroxy-2-oxoglutarate aldolase